MFSKLLLLLPRVCPPRQASGLKKPPPKLAHFFSVKVIKQPDCTDWAGMELSAFGVTTCLRFLKSPSTVLQSASVRHAISLFVCLVNPVFPSVPYTTRSFTNGSSHNLFASFHATPHAYLISTPYTHPESRSGTLIRIHFSAPSTRRSPLDGGSHKSYSGQHSPIRSHKVGSLPFPVVPILLTAKAGWTFSKHFLRTY